MESLYSGTPPSAHSDLAAPIVVGQAGPPPSLMRRRHVVLHRRADTGGDPRQTHGSSQPPMCPSSMRGVGDLCVLMLDLGGCWMSYSPRRYQDLGLPECRMARSRLPKRGVAGEAPRPLFHRGLLGVHLFHQRPWIPRSPWSFF